jgi:hypothetical protein
MAIKATKTTGKLKTAAADEANTEALRSDAVATRKAAKAAAATEKAAASTVSNYYKARTDDQLRAIAEQQYQSYYDQLRLAAQQKSERETTALEGQRAGIERSYQQQQEESAKQYRQAYSQADRETLRRGMQRSSYAAQRLANVNQEGIEAGQRIREAQTAAEGNLDAQIAQVAGQLADTLAGYSAGQAADVMKRYNELQAEEYDRAREATQYAESIRQWQAQFDENVRQFNKLHPEEAATGGGGGYYGGRRSSGGGTRKTNTTNSPTGPTDGMLKQLASSFGPTTKIGGKATGNSASGSTQDRLSNTGAGTIKSTPVVVKPNDRNRPTKY